ncbi:GumC family protein [Mucilaginibacter lacusdianchii]|uniref:GumC family protein n=1 Tax=Mucilaginibacter lacusdianchii TaxID=2684211 RepID=UPI00131C559D|nr:tyrosine-protein kinase family protein [Mucilaginibacter sp. JXJ CY 39]
MKRIRNNIRTVNEPSGINVQQLRVAIYNNRIWFIVFGVLGILAAILYNVVSHQKYKVGMTVLVKQDNTQGTLSALYKQLGVPQNINVQNQVGVLSSFTVNLQTLQNLNWKYSWALDGVLTKKDLYKNAPLAITYLPNVEQTLDVPLHIKILDAQRYVVKASTTREIDGIKRDIDFEETGTFGKPFKNSYFAFTLNKIPNHIIEKDDQFVLTFNDLVLMAKDYQEKLKVTMNDAEANLISVELKSPHLDRAIDYLNELGNVYIQFGLAEKNRLANNTVEFIDKQLAGVSDSLQVASNNVTSYRSNNNIVDVDQQSTSIIENMSKLESDEATARMKVDYFRSLKRYINNSGALRNLVAPSVVGVTDPSLNALVIQLSDLFRQREVLSNTAQEGSPQLVSLNSEIAYTQRSLSENINNLLGNAQLELNNLQQQRQNMGAQRSVLPKKEQNLTNIKRNFDLKNELYTFLLQKRSEAQIAHASRDPDAQILDKASLGTANLVGFNRYVNLIIGFILGLLLPLAFLTSKTFFQKNLVHVSDVSTQLKLPILSNILYNKFNDELPVLTYPSSDITESFRGLRINIQYLLQNSMSKVVAVHSSIAGEGKTFVSANLAAILAITNKTVLLVDADMRKPRTHILFKISNEVGLSNYLQGEAGFTSVVQPTTVSGLSVVCAGPKPQFPSELLNTKYLESFITEAKKHYEYVIINNPPVNIVNDGLMVAPFADINMFLLRIKSSTRNELLYVNNMAQEGLIKNMAVVLNNVTNESIGLYGKNSGGYYSDNRMLTT